MKDKSFHIPVGQFSDRANASSRKAVSASSKSVQMQGESKKTPGGGDQFNNVKTDLNGQKAASPIQTPKAPIKVKAERI